MSTPSALHLHVGAWQVPFEEGAKALGYALLPHQAALATAPAGAYVVQTPTGSGKTLAAFARYLARAESATGPFYGLFVYPTNALLEDQARQLEAVATRGGHRIDRILEGEHAGGDLALLVTTGATLAGPGSKGRRLEDGLDRLYHDYRRGVWITNPDTLFYLMEQYYDRAAEAIKYLSSFPYWVLDEFHLYEGGLLGQIVFLLDRVAVGAVTDVVVMSATPSAATTLLRRWWPEVKTIALQSARPAAVMHSIRHEMDVEVHPVNGRFSHGYEPGLERLLERVQTVYEAETARTADRTSAVSGSAIAARTLVIVDSVAVADWLYQKLAKVYGPDMVGAIHGFVPAARRHVRPLTVGTRAVEVGVDFDAKSLVIEAHDAASALQRLGRAGRHRPAVVHWYLSAAGARSPFARLAERLGAVDSISAAGFVEAVMTALPSPDAWEQFVDSEEGGALYLALWTRVIQALAARGGHARLNPAALRQDLASVIADVRVLDSGVLERTLECYTLRQLSALADAPFRGGHGAIPALWRVPGQEGPMDIDIGDLNRLDWDWDGANLVVSGVGIRRQNVRVAIDVEMYPGRWGRLLPPQRTAVHGLMSTAVAQSMGESLQKHVVTIAGDYLDWRLSGLPLVGSDHRRAYFGIDGLVAAWLHKREM